MHSKSTLDAITSGWAVTTEERDADARGHVSTLDKVLARPYVPVEERILLESVLALTEDYNTAAANRVRNIEKALAWGKVQRAKQLAIDIESERVRLAQEAIDAQEKERKRQRKNALARARRREKKADKVARSRRLCCCNSRYCSIGPFTGDVVADE